MMMLMKVLMNLMMIELIRRVKTAAKEAVNAKKEEEETATAEPVVTHKVKQPVVIEEGGSGLNSRGQMRWSRTAVTDLLDSHRLGLEAKNSNPDKRLADLVHAEFLSRHPYCPIAPPVLLTKCYIFRWAQLLLNIELGRNTLYVPCVII